VKDVRDDIDGKLGFVMLSLAAVRILAEECRFVALYVS
jgi:hypothetical protein